jgi:hypothetical protein
VTASPRQPSWNEVIDTIITSRLRSVHTAMVGEIRSYSEAEQTAEVTLAVQLEGTGGEFETLPPLADVPVAWPGAWESGDSCLLVFAEESFSKWFDTGSVEPPEVLRRHGLHAVCIPLVARAGQDVDFVALKGLVEAALLDLLSNIITAAGSITAPGGGPAFVTALTAYQTLITTPGPTALQVGAEKVKAR